MDKHDINLLAQLVISGLDLFYLSKQRHLELEGRTKQQLISRLEKATDKLKSLPDLDERG